MTMNYNEVHDLVYKHNAYVFGFKKLLSMFICILFLSIFILPVESIASHKEPNILLIIDHDKLINMVKKHDGKTVVVFWAPWCFYCKKEVKAFNSDKEFFKDNNLKVILLSPPGDTKSSIKFLASIKNSFPAYARDNSLKKKLRVSSIPVTVIYTPDGEVYDSERGAKDINALKEMLEEY